MTLQAMGREECVTQLDGQTLVAGLITLVDSTATAARVTVRIAPCQVRIKSLRGITRKISRNPKPLTLQFGVARKICLKC